MQRIAELGMGVLRVPWNHRGPDRRRNSNG